MDLQSSGRMHSSLNVEIVSRFIGCLTAVKFGGSLKNRYKCLWINKTRPVQATILHQKRYQTINGMPSKQDELWGAADFDRYCVWPRIVLDEEGDGRFFKSTAEWGSSHAYDRGKSATTGNFREHLSRYSIFSPHYFNSSLGIPILTRTDTLDARKWLEK